MEQVPTTIDEIIRELWQIKDDMARDHDHDVRALATHLQAHEDHSHLHMTGTNGEVELSETQRTVSSGNRP
jgi:hypothetical protein